MAKRKLSIDQKNLIKRYLMWCYKTTKEELDRIDRKFTQREVDYYILKKLSQKDRQAVGKKYLQDFKRYIDEKEKDAGRLKFSDKNRRHLQPNYVYLKKRLSAVEKAIVAFLGHKELLTIRFLYETEMTRRILEARERK